MLAISSRLPLVNPAAFHYSGGSIWITTSRYAVKVALARRDPRAGFLVHRDGRSVLVQGTLEQYDPLSLNGQVRAALDGPNVYWSMLGYAAKNAAFVGGYLLDIARVPREYWPQNRVVLRLRADRAWSLTAPAERTPDPAPLPGAPRRFGRALGRQPLGYVCWVSGGTPVLVPALWSAGDRHVVAAANLEGLPPPHRSGSGAFVVESHHRFRATKMAGICFRGHLAHGTEADREELAARYGIEPTRLPASLHLDVERVTTWTGFEVHTVRLEAQELTAASPG